LIEQIQTLAKSDVSKEDLIDDIAYCIFYYFFIVNNKYIIINIYYKKNKN